MDFDNLLSGFDDEAGQKEQVALAIYCIEKNTEGEEVAQSDVRNAMGDSRSAVQSSTIP